jgi:formylmethanofuran dehydrogenase subunit E
VGKRSIIAISFINLILVISLVFLSACIEKTSSAVTSSELITFKNGLPVQDGIYIAEIEELIHNGIVEKYGREEFEANILANEIHGHLGAYILVGTKMGLYARELLNAPRKEMQVVSEAWGGKYPLSCINDGILAATLCSAAYDTLLIDKTKSNYAAEFTYEGRTVRLELKEKYKSQLEAKIAEAQSKYTKDGEFTHEYWEEVEEISWWLWVDWDRTEIFDVKYLGN